MSTGPRIADDLIAGQLLLPVNGPADAPAWMDDDFIPNVNGDGSIPDDDGTDWFCVECGEYLTDQGQESEYCPSCVSVQG